MQRSLHFYDLASLSALLAICHIIEGCSSNAVIISAFTAMLYQKPHQVAVCWTRNDRKLGEIARRREMFFGEISSVTAVCED